MAASNIKDTNFNMRINRQKKQDLENLFAQLGMTLPDAVNIFFEKALLEGGLPFDVRLPRYTPPAETAPAEEALPEAPEEALFAEEPEKPRSTRELFEDIFNNLSPEE